jgi:DNA-binding winged helix-turn-helix (wHTH) protein
MTSQAQPTRVQFGNFDLHLQTRELRKDGRRVKLQDQPGKLLALLVCRAGELVTREEIEKALWPEGEFVEFEHAVNTAVRKVREALGDDQERPQFIETLPRKGYRFIAAVATATPAGSKQPSLPEGGAITPGEAEFSMPPRRARWLFLTIQIGYLAMYLVALYRWEFVGHELARTLGRRGAAVGSPVLLLVALCGIAVRLYLLSSVGLNHRAAGAKFRRLFPALFVLDALWAITPLLLIDVLGFGLALGAVAPLAYLPFSQRTLIHSIYGSSAAGARSISAPQT